MKKKRKNLKPGRSQTVAQQSVERYMLNRMSMSDRDFREAITRANGAIPGIKTETTNWGRWSP